MAQEPPHETARNSHLSQPPASHYLGFPAGLSGADLGHRALQQAQRLGAEIVVFAAGDVRHGSVKRVAAAVGEGSMAIAFVHQAIPAEPAAV